MYVPYANTLPTCVGTRLGLRAKSDIDGRARNTGSRVKLWRGRGASRCFTFRPVLDGNLFRDTNIHSHSELPLTTSCFGPLLELWLLNSLLINRSLPLFKPRFSRKRNEYPLGTCGKNISRFPYPRLEAIYISSPLSDSPFTLYMLHIYYLRAIA